MTKDSKDEEDPYQALTNFKACPNRKLRAHKATNNPDTHSNDIIQDA